MNKYSLWLLSIAILLVLIVGCDNLKCSPNVKPDSKGDEKGWIFGGKCGGEF